MSDAHKNFAYTTLTNSPGTSGTTFNVTDGSVFPAPQFNATVWPASPAQPTAANAEIVRVTVVAGNVLTVATRNASTTQEGSNNQTVASGWQIAASITAKTLTDIENNYVNSWSPFVPTPVAFGSQSLMSANAQFQTNSIFLFPITAQFPIKFNQIILPVQLSVISSTNACSATWNSFFGLYSLQTNNTYFSLISSNSFGITESMSAASLSWTYPTTTQTAGYGYGLFPSGNLTGTNPIASFVNGTRAIGLQFGGEMSISGGQYWLGVMALRTTSGFTRGVSVVGIAGQLINPVNQAGTAQGMRALNEAPAEWGISNSNVSAWFGRQMVGLITATTMPNFLGTCMPNGFALHRMGGYAAGQTGTILPTVTFCST
jgi:hypothetical protein